MLKLPHATCGGVSVTRSVAGASDSFSRLLPVATLMHARRASCRAGREDHWRHGPLRDLRSGRRCAGGVGFEDDTQVITHRLRVVLLGVLPASAVQGAACLWIPGWRCWQRSQHLHHPHRLPAACAQARSSSRMSCTSAIGTPWPTWCAVLGMPERHLTSAVCDAANCHRTCIMPGYLILHKRGDASSWRLHRRRSHPMRRRVLL
jgi:hypothetical protein